jgi:hypothetical protein
VLGAACLGGAWKTGPTLTTPEAVPAAAGADELWNFTEPAIVGLGSHQVAMNGVARVSWEVAGSEPYQWMAMGVSIKPDGEILPDAGPDSGADAAADGGGDAAPDRGTAADGTPVAPDEEDGGVEAGGVADVHLRVGCACDTGRARPAGAALPLLFLLVWALRRKAR